MISVCSGAVPVLPTSSSCVADRVLVPLVDSEVVRVRVQEPATQGAVAGEVAAPLILGETVGTSPDAVPH